MRPPIQLKGIREGLLVSLGEGEWTEIEHAFFDQIETQGDFLRGARLILNVENHVLNAALLGKMRDRLSDKGISLWAVLSNSPLTEQNAQALGMATKIHQGHPEKAARVQSSQSNGDEAILIRKTLRSGNSINYSGHVIIIGDVNPGAEIVAGGDIIVWGRLRGLAHAGADGDLESVVCALDLSPTQLRIGDKIAISPEDRSAKKPEMAIVKDDRVVAEPWLYEK